MLRRAMVGTIAVVTTLALLIGGVFAAADQANENMRNARRIPASLIKMDSGSNRKLVSKNHQKISMIDDFDDQVIAIEAISPKEIGITALKWGIQK